VLRFQGAAPLPSLAVNLMPFKFACLAITLTLACITSARGDDSDEIASQLGTLIGSEAACGLTYDQDAIERFINEHVKPSDMSFPSMLDLMTGGTQYEIKRMSESALTAHCAQIRRIAKQYGFTK
jgi:hypothetical protein